MENQKLELLLETLKKDIAFYKPYLKETADEMLSGGFTRFPVFIASQHQVNLGQPLFDRLEFDRLWNINATSVEDLTQAGAILPDKLEPFKQAYKNPADSMCLLMVTDAGAHFVFMPYA